MFLLINSRGRQRERNRPHDSWTIWISVGLYQDFKPCSCLWNFSCGNFVKCKCNENMTIIIMMIISVDRPQPLLRPMTHRWGPASAAGLGFYKYDWFYQVSFDWLLEWMKLFEYLMFVTSHKLWTGTVISFSYQWNLLIISILPPISRVSLSMYMTWYNI